MAASSGKRIIMVVSNDLVTDQRVHRSCTALCEAGYELLLVGRQLSNSKAVTRPYATQRLHLLFKKSACFYAEYNIRLFAYLLRHPADMLYANDTDVLPAVYYAARIKKLPIAYDAHELFPEVPELQHRPRIKQVWTKIEDHFFPKLRDYAYRATCFTVCQSIATYYYQKYQLPMAVVRNVPMPHDYAGITPAEDLLHFAGRTPQSADQGKNILLYQGAVNVGRGLEWIVDAMPLLPDCVLAIVGEGDILNDLRKRVQQRGVEKQVLFLGKKTPQDLRHYTCCADLGMSLLDNMGLSYYYSLPNRIADFVQAQVPALATDFPEIHHIVTTYQIGTLVPEATTKPELIAHYIHQTLQYWQALPLSEKQQRFARAANELSWSRDQQVLLAAIAHTI